MVVRHEAVQESVPEAVKNMLLVLASSGVLTPQWRVRACRALCVACCGRCCCFAQRAGVQ